MTHHNDDDELKFRRSEMPRVASSKFAPYWPQIKSLRRDGYTLAQVCKFLQRKKIVTTVGALSAYIKRRQQKECVDTQPELSAIKTARIRPQQKNDTNLVTEQIAKFGEQGNARNHGQTYEEFLKTNPLLKG